MIALTKVQIDDLREIQELCIERNADLVIVGAIAYQYNFPNELRHTGDIDLAVALDLNDFAGLESGLRNRGWSQVPQQEQRWRSPRGNPVDLIPAGGGLRETRQVIWPKSGFTMSLVGFEHVFSAAEPTEIGGTLTVRIIPARVLMLLKIVAYLDDPNRRGKDLSDMRAMLKLYERDSDRIYSQAVLDAALSDIDLASAFLLGLDLRSMCTLDELVIVHRFLALAGEEANPSWQAFVHAAPHIRPGDEEAARAELAAFARGLNTVRNVSPGETPAPQASLWERLEVLAKQGAIVTVRPISPRPPQDQFQMIGIDPANGVLITKKNSSDQEVLLPLSQIDDVLRVGLGVTDLVLKGRLQWMTLVARWKIQPEKPDSHWGIAKPSADNDPRVRQIQHIMDVNGYNIGWANENRVNTVPGADCEIIYDDDGFYFRKKDRPFDQILVRSRKV